jgi:hypothetical protein
MLLTRNQEERKDGKQRHVFQSKEGRVTNISGWPVMFDSFQQRVHFMHQVLQYEIIAKLIIIDD